MLIEKIVKSAKKINVVVQHDFYSQTLDSSLWKSDPNVFYSAIADLARDLETKQTDAIHSLLYHLQSFGLLNKVFSLDWGQMEKKSCIAKEKIIKVYGNVDRAICEICGATSGKQEFQEALETTDLLSCREFSCHGNLMRPAVVLPEGRFPKDYLIALNTSLRQADLLLCFLFNPEADSSVLYNIASKSSNIVVVGRSFPQGLSPCQNVTFFQTADPTLLAKEIMNNWDREEEVAPLFFQYDLPIANAHQQCTCIIM